MKRREIINITEENVIKNCLNCDQEKEAGFSVLLRNSLALDGGSAVEKDDGIKGFVEKESCSVGKRELLGIGEKVDCNNRGNKYHYSIPELLSLRNKVYFRQEEVLENLNNRLKDTGICLKKLNGLKLEDRFEKSNFMKLNWKEKQRDQDTFNFRNRASTNNAKDYSKSENKYSKLESKTRFSKQKAVGRNKFNDPEILSEDLWDTPINTELNGREGIFSLGDIRKAENLIEKGGVLLSHSSSASNREYDIVSNSEKNKNSVESSYINTYYSSVPKSSFFDLSTPFFIEDGEEQDINSAIKVDSTPKLFSQWARDDNSAKLNRRGYGNDKVEAINYGDCNNSTSKFLNYKTNNLSGAEINGSHNRQRDTHVEIHSSNYLNQSNEFKANHLLSLLRANESVQTDKVSNEQFRLPDKNNTHCSGNISHEYANSHNLAERSQQVVSKEMRELLYAFQQPKVSGGVYNNTFDTNTNTQQNTDMNFGKFQMPSQLPLSGRDAGRLLMAVLGANQNSKD